MCAKRVREVDAGLRIAAESPLIVPVEDLVVPGTEWEGTEALIKKLLSSYRRTLAHQHHPIEDRDPLFLQVKEAQASVLERLLGKSEFSHHGQRVVAGQRLMQAASDIFLGRQRIRGLDGRTRDYYVRQFHDWKGGADVDRLLVPGATLYARICGATLARAHAR